jgi:hypothetical protein
MGSVAERRSAFPPETNGYDMVKIRQFNADAAAHLSRFVAAAVDLRDGTRNRVAETREVVAQSRALLRELSDVLANDAVRTGWPTKGGLWPS